MRFGPPTHSVRLLILGLACVLPLSTAQAQGRPSPQQLKHEVAREVASLQKLTQVIVDMVFSFSEMGFEEYWTSEYLSDILRNEDFQITPRLAGMPTGFAASWGSGKPVIALVGEIDASPETSQKPGVSYWSPLIPGGPGHANGHNVSPAADVVAAIAAKRIMERHGLSGTLKLIPGIAEEMHGGARTHYVNSGVFDDVDIVLSTHVGSDFYVSWGIRGSFLISTLFTFHGETAHGASEPWRGRSALDAVQLMDIGWNFRREHLRLQQRSHSVIRYGGAYPNLVPSRANAWYFFRELEPERVQDLAALGHTIAEAAAAMTSTTVEQLLLGSSWPLNMNRPLAERVAENIRAVGLPEWSDADVALAKATQREVGAPEVGLTTTLDDVIREDFSSIGQGVGAGTDDVAELSWNIPTVRLRFPADIPGTPLHHWSSTVSMATPIAHKGTNYGARALAMTVVDVLMDPNLVEEAWRYFREVQTKDLKWYPLIPTGTEPPVTMNRDFMARFRPELERLRYDPERYETYLEQLGIPYPTVRRTDGID